MSQLATQHPVVQHHGRGAMLTRFDCKRLGNTPFRREACVVKWLDEWKTEDVGAPTTHPLGNSAASG